MRFRRICSRSRAEKRRRTTENPLTSKRVCVLDSFSRTMSLRPYAEILPTAEGVERLAELVSVTMTERAEPVTENTAVNSIPPANENGQNFASAGDGASATEKVDGSHTDFDEASSDYADPVPLAQTRLKHSDEFLQHFRVLDDLVEGAYGFICDVRRYTEEEQRRRGVNSTSQGKSKCKRLIAKYVKNGTRAASQLENEILVLGRLNHENVLKIQEILRYPDNTYMLTQRYQFDLYSYMYEEAFDWKDSPMLKQTRRIMKQLMSAVSYIHSKKLIHRDIKLENIFLNCDGTTVLGDFGTVTPFENEREPFEYGWVGTVATNSPEILARDSYCEITDIWSCGVVLLEMVSHEFCPIGDGGGNPHQQLLKVIDSLSVCDEEFPDPPCNLYNYLHYASIDRAGHTVPSLIRNLHLPADVEYPLVKMLTFDWRLRPSAAEVLAMPLFSAEEERTITIIHGKHKPIRPEIRARVPRSMSEG
nr:serine/threonine protein kinase US3 [Gallid alphaherpesvirus 1]